VGKCRLGANRPRRAWLIEDALADKKQAQTTARFRDGGVLFCVQSLEFTGGTCGFVAVLPAGHASLWSLKLAKIPPINCGSLIMVLPQTVPVCDGNSRVAVGLI